MCHRKARNIFGRRIAACVLVFSATASVAHASGHSVLYAFQGGSDGANPYAGVIADGAGNLYGTTVEGGAHGYGTVFKVAPDGTETVLHSFTGSDGSYPYGTLIADKKGRLYGTTYAGGKYDKGTVFKLGTDGRETVLHSLDGGGDGTQPMGGLIADKAGNLYGTATLGGTHGAGTVFEITPNGAETVLHYFSGGSDGVEPNASLIADKQGNLYGTTLDGGNKGCSVAGCGTVFKVTADGAETVLHGFAGGDDGLNPYAPLVIDKEGNLYGTTYSGGSHNAGIVFRIAPDGKKTVVYPFKFGNDGGHPLAGLVKKNGHAFYGVTAGGGGAADSGTVFKLTANGKERVLYSFQGGSDGKDPIAGLTADAAGNLYGTTYSGGSTGCNGTGCGTVFKIVE